MSVANEAAMNPAVLKVTLASDCESHTYGR